MIDRWFQSWLVKHHLDRRLQFTVAYTLKVPNSHFSTPLKVGLRKLARPRTPLHHILESSMR